MEVILKILRYIYNYFLDRTNSKKYIKIFDNNGFTTIIKINELLNEVEKSLLKKVQKYDKTQFFC